MLTAETTHTVVNDGVQIFCRDYGTPAPAGATSRAAVADSAHIRATPTTPTTSEPPDTAATSHRLAVADGAAPSLLLVHGLAGYADEWAPLARRLRSRHRVVAYDARGHGASDRRPADGDLSRSAHVRDAVAVMEQLALERTVLIGQSIGGVTALLTAAARPDLVRALVLVEAGAKGLGPDLPRQIGAWLDSWPVPFESVDAASEFFGGGPAGRGWAEGLEARADGLYPRFDPDVMIACATDGVSGAAVAGAPQFSRSYDKEWAQIQCPVLVVRGDNGRLPASEVAEMCARRPGTRTEVVGAAGHDVHLDQPTALHQLIEAFLSSLPSVP